MELENDWQMKWESEIYVEILTSNFISFYMWFLLGMIWFSCSTCGFHRKQVMQVVQKTESLKRISFLAHSLGGLFARYAIAILYSPNSLSSAKPNDLANPTMLNSQTAYSSKRGMIAGLEPINFITLATPHLGVRGKKQVRSEGYSVSPLFYCDYDIVAFSFTTV